MEVHTEQQLDKMPAAKFKTLENKVRRMLARRGYKLIKSRARDPAAIGYGDYVIREAHPSVRGTKPLGWMQFHEIERWLATGKEPRQ